MKFSDARWSGWLLLCLMFGAAIGQTQEPGTVKWEFVTGGGGSSPAIGANGTVYVGGYDKSVFALEGQTGIKRWEYLTGGAVFSSPAIGADGTVYVGSMDAKVYALDGQTGVKLWGFTTESGVGSSPAIGADGTVYVGSYDKKVYALEGRTGIKRWEFLTGDGVYSSPAIGADGTVYVGSYDRKIYALDGQTGAKRWDFLVGGLVESSPAIGSDGTVYIGSDDKKIYALDGQTGVKRWEFLTGDFVFSSPSIGADGTVYVGSYDKKVYALDGQTGVKRWEFLTGSGVWSSPTIGADGTVYVGSYDNKIYALEGQTGIKLWEFFTGGNVYASPTIGADGTIYVGSYDQKVYAINSSRKGLAESAWPKFRGNAPNTGIIPGVAPAEGFIWRVTSGAKTLYLGGTLHALRVQDSTLPISFDTSFSSARRLLLESDIDLAQSTPVQDYLSAQAFYPPGTTLSSQVTAGLYTALQGLARQAGYPQDIFDGYRPWFVSSFVSTIQLTQAGFDTGLGVDRHYLDLAKKFLKPRKFLETPQQGIDAAVAGASADWIKALTYQTGLANGAAEATVEGLYGGAHAVSWWKAGKLDGFAGMADKMAVETPSLYAELVKKRNQAWLPQITTQLQTGETAMVLVGALHLAGPDGLLALLKGQGYTLSALPLSKPYFRQFTPNQYAPAGATFAFAANTGGAEPMVYQWQKDGVAIAGATGATLTLTAVSAASEGSYTLFVKNEIGEATSKAVTFRLFAAPVITLQPMGQTNEPWNIIPLTVEAKSAGPLSYQWQLNGADLAGQTNASLLFRYAQLSDSGRYKVAVSNAVGRVQSAEAVVRVLIRPEITLQPVGQTTETWSTITLTVAARGDAPLLYQWQRDGVDVTGQTNATLTLENAQPSHSGRYLVNVSNPVTAITSEEVAVVVHPPGPGVRRWDFSAGAYVYSSPAMGTNGWMYVGGLDGKVYGLEAKTGVKGWEFVTGDAVFSSPAIGAEGMVYVGSYDHKVYGLDGVSGVKKWEFATGDYNRGAPAIGADGTVYVGSGDEKVYALDGVTGVKKWEFVTGGAILGSPGIGADGTVYIGSSDGRVYALDGVTGVKRWAFLAGNWVYGSPALGADGTVYIGSGDHKVYALNGQTGSKVWEFAAGDWIYGSPALGADGTVYVGSGDHNVYALDGKTGSRRWEFVTGGAIRGTPAIGADGTVYVGSVDARVYALNGQTGAKVWEFVTGAEVWSSPALGSDGTVYIGSDDGKLYAVASASQGLAHSAWPMAGQNARHTGYNPAVAAMVLVNPKDSQLMGWDALVLSVGAYGSGPIYYQWQRNGVNVSGETNGTLSIAHIRLADSGRYAVVVSNIFGFSRSAEVEVAVAELPTRLTLDLGTTQTQSAPMTVHLKLFGSPGATRSVEWSSALGPASVWLYLTNLVLGADGVAVIDLEVGVRAMCYRAREFNPEALAGLVWIAPGTLVMGSPISEPGRQVDEVQHIVMLTQGYWMSDHETTQAEYEAVVGINPSDYKGAALPVENISWDDAVAYCVRLTEMERKAGRLPAGYEYRLPTEAQWEYAARAGSTGATYGAIDEIAWYNQNAGSHTHQVKTKEANAWGLYDMSGNVLEWCSDLYGDYPTGAVTDPVGASSGSARVLRGCSWVNAASDCRSAGRYSIIPAYHYDFFGFRPVLSPDNNAPVLRVVPNQKMNEGTALSLTLHATDLDIPVQTLTYKLVSGPVGMSVSGLGSLNWTPTHAQWPSTNTVLVAVTDGIVSVTNSFAVIVNPAGPSGFVWVAPGTFVMGSPVSELGHTDSEVQHNVTLTKGYWMSDHETTQAEYEAVIGTNPSSWKWATLPVEQVSWDDAVAYCVRLTEMERKAGRLPAGYEYRLPTEAQWEYAARAGTTGAYYGVIDAIAWYRDNARGIPHEVKTKEANPLGLYDMSGNVWEWCSDLYGDYPTGAVTDPVGGNDGSSRVFRGGDWYDVVTFCRSAQRLWFDPGFRLNVLGFRPALCSVR